MLNNGNRRWHWFLAGCLSCLTVSLPSFGENTSEQASSGWPTLPLPTLGEAADLEKNSTQKFIPAAGRADADNASLKQEVSKTVNSFQHNQSETGKSEQASARQESQNSQMSEMQQMQLQDSMAERSRLMETTSNLLKRQNQTQRSIMDNIK